MVIGPGLARGLRVRDTEMINMSMDANGIDRAPVTVMGGIPVKLSLNNEEIWETQQLVYVVKEVEQPVVNEPA